MSRTDSISAVQLEHKELAGGKDVPEGASGNGEREGGADGDREDRGAVVASAKENGLGEDKDGIANAGTRELPPPLKLEMLRQSQGSEDENTVSGRDENPSSRPGSPEVVAVPSKGIGTFVPEASPAVSSVGSLPPAAAKFFPPSPRLRAKQGSRLGDLFRRKSSESSEQVLRKKRRKRIGDYEVLSFLGKGTQGFVLKCKHLTSGHIVAIKTVLGGSQLMTEQWMGTTDNGSDASRAEGRKDAKGTPREKKKLRILGGGGGGRDPSKIRLVSQEIALLKKVNHPNIVKLLSVIDPPGDDDIHLVFEFCSGGPLRQLSDNLLLNSSGLPLLEEEVRVYFRQLCSAVRYLHFHGIIHRDIKPSNLIIDRPRQLLKLSDLGLAMQTKQSKANKVLGNDDDLIGTTLIVGTPAFLPPEYYRIRRSEEEQQEMLLRNPEIGSGMLDAESVNGAFAKMDPDACLASAEGDAGQPRKYFPGRAADVWATGVTLYAMVFGMLPHLQASRRMTTKSTSLLDSIRSISTKNSSSDASELSENNRKGGAASAVPDSSGLSGKDVPLDVLQERIISNPLRFPGIGLGTSAKLRNLLAKMLDKDPRRRIRIEEICCHEWTTTYEPMPSMSQEQMNSIEPTAADRVAAILRPETVLQMCKRQFRRLRATLHVFSYRSARSSYDAQEKLKSEETGLAAQVDSGQSGLFANSAGTNASLVRL